PEDQERLANIEELITAARQFAAEDSSRTIADFLENITLASDVDGWDENQDCVSIMTLHAAKGLEFPVVYMAALEQGLLPHERSLEKLEELEEERRLAFVGMTRAKEELNLSLAQLREFRGTALYTIPSMFLSELPAENVQTIDLLEDAKLSASDEWRGGSPAADEAWPDSGFTPRRRPEPVRVESKSSRSTTTTYVEGMMVRHDQYGVGRVTAV